MSDEDELITMTPDQVDIVTAKHLVSPMLLKKGTPEGATRGNHSGGVRTPRLFDVEILIHEILNANGDWVLIDRNRSAKTYNDSSARHIALKRRGFEVTSRTVPGTGVRNYWARWTHDQPSVKVPAASTDDPRMITFGIDRRYDAR